MRPLAPFRTLLLPIRNQKTATHCIQSASLLAGRLGAEIYVVAAGREKTIDTLLDSTRRFGAELVILASSQIFGLNAQEFLNNSPVPVLLLPDDRDWNWDSVLVPMSGEIRQNSALEAALYIANLLEIPIDVIHVAPAIEAEAQACGQCVVENYTDHPHHEYPHRIDQFLAEAAPFTTARERSRIRNVSLVSGDPAREIISQIHHRASGLVIAEWHGSLHRGRARTLRGLLRHPEFPLLLVKPADQHYQLRIRLIAS